MRLDKAKDTNSSNKYECKELLEAGKLMSILAKHDALTIFLMANDGIRADASTNVRIGLSKKQYYTRLAQLKSSGLIEKIDGYYFQTTLGAFLQRTCVYNALYAVRNRRDMFMIDLLSKEGHYSHDELIRMKNAFCNLPMV